MNPLFLVSLATFSAGGGGVCSGIEECRGCQRGLSIVLRRLIAILEVCSDFLSILKTEKNGVRCSQFLSISKTVKNDVPLHFGSSKQWRCFVRRSEHGKRLSSSLRER